MKIALIGLLVTFSFSAFATTKLSCYESFTQVIHDQTVTVVNDSNSYTKATMAYFTFKIEKDESKVNQKKLEKLEADALKLQNEANKSRAQLSSLYSQLENCLNSSNSNLTEMPLGKF